MKSNRTSLHSARWLTGLLCAGLVAVASPGMAADGHHGGHHPGHGSYTHHYNSHYQGHSHGHSGVRSFGHYDPAIGYYDGYYNDYPVYSPHYRGHRTYGHSGYGHSHHNSLSLRLHL